MILKMSKNIFLTGFMGAGKSTVGRRLAVNLDYRFADLDQLIVAREGKSIPDIFASYGETYFRDCESTVLADQSSSSRTVYATGGGIVGRAENRALMKQLGWVVCLRADWTTLQRRLARGTGRPLADPQKDWSVVWRLWQSRLAWYEEADLVIDTDCLRLSGVVHEIISRLEVEVNKQCDR